VITRVLRNRFIFGPSLLSSAIKPFNGLDHRFAFHKLVEEYLPEEDLSGPNAVKKFAALFSKKYFPIAAGTYSPEMEDLIKGIPARFHGMSRYNYDAYAIPDAQMLASVLCISPVSAGARVVVMEKFAKKGGEPLDGWLLEDVLDGIGNKYPGLQDWCRWSFNQTGNFWLDKTETLPWSRKKVSGTSIEYQTMDNVVLELHSHGKMSAFFSGQDNKDEQGFRVYAVAGRLNDEPQIRLRIGIYGYFREILFQEVFDGPCPIDNSTGDKHED
jgi:hypothetical protein